MIFSDGRLITAIRRGQKTATRRAMVLGQPCKYQPGRTYAVQAKRGRWGGRELCRVLVTRVEPGSLADMTDADARLEGFPDLAAFRAYWKQIHRDTQSWSVPVWVIHFVRFTRRQPHRGSRSASIVTG